MIHEYYKELQNNQNIRENLSLLRSECKDPQARETLLSLVGDGALLTGLLESDEPKVRKNAALLLGSLGLLQTAGSLFHAYEREQTLFVRSAYLTALSGMEVSPYLEALKEHRDALLAREIPENEKKHVNEELRELERIITAAEGITRHTFVGFTEPQDFLLATNREQRGVTLEEVKAVSASVRRSEKLHPLGVLVHAKDVRPFASIRTYRELLFPVRTAQPVPEDAVGAAEAVWDSNLRELLTQAHRETTPFYFRLEIKSHMPLDKKSTFARRFSAELERLSGRMLVNAPSDYEIELRELLTQAHRELPEASFDCAGTFCLPQKCGGSFDSSGDCSNACGAGRAVFKRKRADSRSVLRCRHDVDRAGYPCPCAGKIRN